MRIPHCTAMAALTLSLSMMTQAAGTADTQVVRDACRREALQNHVAMDDMDEYLRICIEEVLAHPNGDRGLLPNGDAEPFSDGDVELPPEGDQEPAPVD